MDAYIRNELNLNSDLTLEQAVTHSTKLLVWLLDCQESMQMGQQQKDLEVGFTDIECMFKATLYLHECHTRHGDALVEAVLLQCTQAQSSIRRYYENCDRDRMQCIRELCAGIINGTRNGHSHAPILYQMHKAYAEVQPMWSCIKDLDWSALEHHNSSLNVATAAAVELNVNVLQMRQLVQRIFRLANVEHMKIALERAMERIGCDLWLHLFREPKESILYTRCYLLRHMICDMLEEQCSPSASFVHNIYLFVAASSSNLSRLFCWLLHGRFAGALGSYLRGYWTLQLPHLQLDDIQSAPGAPPSALPLDEIIYLTHLLLTPKSPCRSQFYQQLQLLPLLNRLLQLLNKVAYAYS